MHPRFSLLPLLALASAPFCVQAGAPAAKEPQPVAVQPAPSDWQITASLPLWISGIDGTVGVRGYTADTSASFLDIVRNLDMIAAGNLEIRKGRWGGWIDGAYLKASVGADTPGPLLDSLNVGIEQITLEAALFYRAWQSDRGFLDLYAGARYWSLRGSMEFDVDDRGLRQVSEELSERAIDQVVTAVKNRVRGVATTAASRVASDIAPEVRSRVADVVAAKAEQVRTVLGDLQQIAAAHPRLVEILRRSERVRDAIEAAAEARIAEQTAIAQAQVDELRAATAEARRKASAARASATSRARRAISKAEKKLAREIESTLREAIPTEVVQSTDWVDPFVGLRGLYRFTDRFYAITKADIGGFSVGSQLSWSAYAAVGMHVTASGNTTLELGYKHLALDYASGGFVYDMATSGPMLNLSIRF